MRVISLGLGVQSTAMYFMSSMNEIDRADYAIFADPGAEHDDTYKMLEFALKWQKEHDGIPIIAKQKNLLRDLLSQQNSTGQRFASIPAFAGASGMLRRQCTKEYKIDVVVKAMRELYGLKPHKRMPMSEVWLGITLDEMQRLKESRLPRIKYRYPLYEKEMTRGNCAQWLKDHDIPVPPKSACSFCPYQNDYRWKRTLESERRGEVIAVDKAIRDSSKRGISQPIYLHHSLTPLDELQFADQMDMFDDIEWSCDEGFCHF